MSKIKFKKLDIHSNKGKEILLKYFFKKPNTVLNKEELLSISCIHYNTKQKNIIPYTSRVKTNLELYKNKIIENEDVDKILQDVLESCFTIHEELICCELTNRESIDYFYIAVIGVDFFLTENEIRKKD